MPPRRWLPKLPFSGFSEGFVQNGARVYISSRDAKACEQACKELNALGKGEAFSIPADFYKEEDCKKLAQELAKKEKSTFPIGSQTTALLYGLEVVEHKLRKQVFQLTYFCVLEISYLEFYHVLC